MRWTAAPWTDAPETVKPTETEDMSVEMDITDFVLGYKRSENREAMTQEVKVTFINQEGNLTPNNNLSPFNRLTLNGVERFAPMVGEGNEIQIYRVRTLADLETETTVTEDGVTLTTYKHMDRWVSRFRGRIRSIHHATEQGHDSLEVSALGVLGEALKRTFSGTFSPIMRTSSVVPSNSYYTLPTLTAAVQSFRSASPSGVMYAAANTFGKSIAQPKEIPPALLARLLFWDREDAFRNRGWRLSAPYFGNNSLPGELSEVSTTLVPVNPVTATAVWGLNGTAWLAAGNVDKNAGDVFQDEEGSLALGDGASLTCDLYKLPQAVPARFSLAVKNHTGARVRLTVSRVKFSLASLTEGAIEEIESFDLSTEVTTYSPQTTFGTAIALNPTDASAVEWRRVSARLAALPAEEYDADPDFMGMNCAASTSGEEITLYRVCLKVTGGEVLVDRPRLEFDAVTKDPETDQAVIVSNDLGALHAFERWTTADGVTYVDPNPEHRILSKKGVRVFARCYGAPYPAGTELGYSPIHLKNRSLPESVLYVRELVEGQDFEILTEKGAIQLSAETPRIEILVAHQFYDLSASYHMEATNIIRRMLVQGAGIPSAHIDLEPTGVILSKVSIDPASTTSLQKALKDILEQLPGNYDMRETGDARVVGRYIQQAGSPRIMNPVKQVPIAPDPTILVPGKEYWYGVSALMPDGKETVISNLASTVPYMDYYDASHRSYVQRGISPGILVRPVPGMVALVVRRAKAVRSAADTMTQPPTAPKYRWNFNSGVDDLGDAQLSGVKFTSYTVSDLTVGDINV